MQNRQRTLWRSISRSGYIYLFLLPTLLFLLVFQVYPILNSVYTSFTDLSMVAQGCQSAYNLDGGSSSTVVLNNQKINALSTGKTRQISDIIYFASATGAQ